MYLYRNIFITITNIIKNIILKGGKEEEEKEEEREWERGRRWEREEEGRRRDVNKRKDRRMKRRRRKKKESSPTPPRCQELHPRSVPVEGPLALNTARGQAALSSGAAETLVPTGKGWLCDSDFSHRSALSVLQHQGSQPEAHPHDRQAAQMQGHCHQIQALVPLPEEEEAKVWGRNDIQLSWVCTQGCVSEATQ